MKSLCKVLMLLCVTGVFVACGSSLAPNSYPGAKESGGQGAPANYQDSGTAPTTEPNNPAPPPTGPQDPPKVPETNPWEDPTKDNLSTFAIDVDTGSYTYSRRILQSGGVVPSANVRVEEFINYFDYNYADPKDDLPFLVDVGGTISPHQKDRYFLRVGIQGRRMTQEQRDPIHLTFLIDTSCSMSGGDRLGLLKKSLAVLVGQLKGSDTVAVATYAGSVRNVLSPTSGSEKDKILDAINNLKSGGGTAMGSGMELAYKLAADGFVQGRVNRVIVLSDGDANIGRTNQDEILKTIEKHVEKGITMTTVGFGMGNYRDNRMEQLANKGNGNSFYIDSLEEAERVFRDKFIPNMIVIAKDVKVQVEFNAKYVARYRLIGYENRNIADKDFRNDKVDAGELGAGHNVTALYEVELHKADAALLISENSSTPLVTVRLRYKTPGASKEDKAREIAQPAPVGLLHRTFADTPWNLQWATMVASFAEILRKSPHAKGWDLQAVLKFAKAAAQSNDKTHSEFLGLVENYKP